jgi:hypothetical protein
MSAFAAGQGEQIMAHWIKAGVNHLVIHAKEEDVAEVDT